MALMLAPSAGEESDTKRERKHQSDKEFLTGLTRVLHQEMSDLCFRGCVCGRGRIDEAVMRARVTFCYLPECLRQSQQTRIDAGLIASGKGNHWRQLSSQSPDRVNQSSCSMTHYIDKDLAGWLMINIYSTE